MTYHELVTSHGSPAAAWEACRRRRDHSDAHARATAALERAAACGAAFLLPGDDAYPAPLLELPDPPPHLFVLGDPRRLAEPCVSVVGTRDCSPYAERVTRDLAGALAAAGATVVSGMARGVDAAAHRAALASSSGRTAAVLGTGVDVAYPAAHRSLHAEIARTGVVLSEELPGTRATPGSFPRRNRIIAALSRVTIVVEAGFRSGALITAMHALELGRTVAAVPGPIDSPRSAGSNELLRDGAVVIASIEDALVLAGTYRAKAVAPTFGSAAERALWEALAAGSADVDTLADRALLPIAECLAALTALELAGAVDCTLTGEVQRRGART